MILSMTRKNYSDEFRRQAVDLYESTRVPREGHRRRPRGLPGTLSDRVKTFGTGSTAAPISSPRTPSGRPETSAEKQARLEAENAQLQVE